MTNETLRSILLIYVNEKKNVNILQRKKFKKYLKKEEKKEKYYYGKNNRRMP